MAGLVYCRRCDLAFCERHVPDHPNMEGHRLEPAAHVELFCCVCGGIYRPAPRAPATGTDA